MKKLISTIFLSFALLFSLNVHAAKLAVIYDSGGKFDKSFNELAYNAAEKFKADTGIDYMDFEAANNAQIEQGLRKLVDRGASVVVAMGFSMADAISAVAAENPDVNFTIIDVNWLQGDNIQQFVFKEHEGSFLVGMIAAMKSQTGTVGFVGGMDIPLIRKFHGGYEQGAKYVNPDINVLMNMTGTTPEAWNNPTKGAELTKAQIDKGVDMLEIPKQCLVQKVNVLRDTADFAVDCDIQGIKNHFIGHTNFRGDHMDGQMSSEMNSPMGTMVMTMNFSAKRIGACPAAK